jgi:hypothetical protein
MAMRVRSLLVEGVGRISNDIQRPLKRPDMSDEIPIGLIGLLLSRIGSITLLHQLGVSLPVLGGGFDVAVLHVDGLLALPLRTSTGLTLLLVQSLPVIPATKLGIQPSLKLVNSSLKLGLSGKIHLTKSSVLGSGLRTNALNNSTVRLEMAR